jgi:1-aminocyclopropane-1-carboxylate deaminase/D-cysteine desulfhydrase-like pyridoxal-dependent ACC family enzyme
VQVGSREHRYVKGPQALTLVEFRGWLWFKRDDLFEIGGVCGGKARACFVISQSARNGLVTACSRHSPQADIVASIATHLQLRSWIHTPAGTVTEELRLAVRHGAQTTAHKAGYNSVIIARARADAENRRATLIPFGMESREAVECTAHQTENLPHEARRIVVPVGSGLTLAGILVGLTERRRRVPVLGIVVGADPHRRLDRWAPAGWRHTTNLVRSELPYHRSAPITELSGVPLDPIYEAKCLPFMKRGDCFWIVGHRTG